MRLPQFTQTYVLRRYFTPTTKEEAPQLHEAGLLPLTTESKIARLVVGTDAPIAVDLQGNTFVERTVVEAGGSVSGTQVYKVLGRFGVETKIDRDSLNS